MVDVQLDVLRPFFRKIFLGVDRLDGTFIDAETAVDAGVGIDEQLNTLVDSMTGGGNPQQVVESLSNSITSVLKN